MDSAAQQRPRLVVAVAPTLLGDVLCRALRFEGLEVVLYGPTGDQDLHAQPRQYALAVVSEDVPDDVDAAVVIRLPELPDADLAGVLAQIHSALSYPGGLAGSSIA